MSRDGPLRRRLHQRHGEDAVPVAGGCSVPQMVALLTLVVLVGTPWAGTGPVPTQTRRAGLPVTGAAEHRAIDIAPGQDIQANVAAAPAGSTFRLKAGVHRLQTIRPKDADTFIGESGAVLSGARLLSTFDRSGSMWVATGQTQEGSAQGECQAGHPRCRLPEQLFIDDRALEPVDSLALVRPGTWYFDYPADRIYFADDPTSRRVEISSQPEAISATADHVTVKGLIVEKYANPAQHGAISSAGRIGWTIQDTEVRWNHGMGIQIGSGARVLGNNVHGNGQLGIGGGGIDVVVEANEIASNNSAHFDASWEAGGTKFVGTDRLIVRGNFVHHNQGPGLWTDDDNRNTIYENNIVDDNERMGIFHEISYAATIRNNVVRRNGFGFSEWAWGAGILIAASPDVEVYGNTVENNADGITAVQQRRGSGILGAHQIANLWVHDNTVDMLQGWTGLAEDVGDDSYFTSRNNRFDRNHYRLGPAAAFVWISGQRSESEWRMYGQDVNGTFAR